MQQQQNKLRKGYKNNSISNLKSGLNKLSPELNGNQTSLDTDLYYSSVLESRNKLLSNKESFNNNPFNNKKQFSVSEFEDADNRYSSHKHTAIKATHNPFSQQKSSYKVNDKLPTLNYESETREKSNSFPNDPKRSYYDLNKSKGVSFHSKIPHHSSSHMNKSYDKNNHTNNVASLNEIYQAQEDDYDNFLNHAKNSKSAQIFEDMHGDQIFDENEMKIQQCEEQKPSLKQKLNVPYKKRLNKNNSFTIKSSSNSLRRGNNHDKNSVQNSDEKFLPHESLYNQRSKVSSESLNQLKENDKNKKNTHINQHNSMSKFDLLKERKAGTKNQSVNDRNSHAFYRAVNKIKTTNETLEKKTLRAFASIIPNKKKQKDKSISEMIEVDEEMLKDVETVENRNFYSLSAKSIKGYYSEHDKPNQDSYQMKFDFIDRNSVLLGVFDGHGLYGHLISQYVQKYFIRNLIRHSEIMAMMNNQDKFVLTKEYDVRKLIEHTYRLTNNELNQEVKQAQESGSTGVSIMIANNQIYTANIGDSEAAIVYFDRGKNQYELKKLTTVHQANNEYEKERIERSGGRCEQQKDKRGKYYGPMRVWPKDKNTLGLMMTRSFGDQTGHDIGMTAVPAISVENKTKDIIAVVIGSDGVWEVCKERHIINIVVKYYDSKDSQKAVAEMTELSELKWKADESDDYIDDITAIVGYLK